jgi:hypothetical protein
MGAAVTALSVMDYAEAAEVFRALINESKGGAICIVAIEALGKWSYKEAYGDLVTIVKDPSIQIGTRLAAARVLGQWKR